MKKIFIISLLIIIFFIKLIILLQKTMKDLPYHHLPDGTFRNPEGSPLREILILNGTCQNGMKEKKKN